MWNIKLACFTHCTLCLSYPNESLKNDVLLHNKVCFFFFFCFFFFWNTHTLPWLWTIHIPLTPHPELIITLSKTAKSLTIEVSRWENIWSANGILPLSNRRYKLSQLNQNVWNSLQLRSPATKILYTSELNKHLCKCSLLHQWLIEWQESYLGQQG